MLRKVGWGLLVLAGICHAEEPAKSAEAWVAELNAAYAKVDGYLATYRSEGENKKMECVLGLDKRSGLVVLHLLAENRGQKMAARQWNTRDGELFVDNGELLVRILGIQQEVLNLVELRKAVDRRLADAEFSGDFHFIPNLSITKTSLDHGIFMSDRRRPAWEPAVEKAAVLSFNADSVTFATTRLGQLTVSRENGMMTRQSVTSDQGEVRTLELAKLELNPGDKVLEAISADWETKKAKQAGAGAITMKMRKRLFAEIIGMVETGRASLDKLESVLGDQADSLRNFTAACLSDTQGMGGDPDTADLFRRLKETMRERWKATPAGATGSEKDFEAYLADPELRRRVRDELVSGMMEDKVVWKRPIFDLFGRREGGEPTWENEAGEAAQLLIDKAVAKAYLEALCDRKIAATWAEREGLE